MLGELSDYFFGPVLELLVLDSIDEKVYLLAGDGVLSLANLKEVGSQGLLIGGGIVLATDADFFYSAAKGSV